MTIFDLPAVNASLNGLSAVFLTLGFVFIKRGNKIAHRNCMISAFVTSIVFLGCYLTYHGYLAYALHRGPTRFLEPQWFRPIYLTILLTHTILAIAIVPMILITLMFRSEKLVSFRKKIAFPITLLACALPILGLLSRDVVTFEGLTVLTVVFAFSSLLLHKFQSHKAIARWTWPLWMYVSVTGVVVYLLLYQIFPQK
jgi:uncharacterized membrane protein YozB (DUF420 family)